MEHTASSPKRYADLEEALSWEPTAEEGDSGEGAPSTPTGKAPRTPSSSSKAAMDPQWYAAAIVCWLPGAPGLSPTCPCSHPLQEGAEAPAHHHQAIPPHACHTARAV